MAKLLSTPDAMFKQIIGGVVLIIIGAMFSFLLTSSATQYRMQRNEDDIKDVRSQLAGVKSELANGGPAPLALRVTRVEEGLGTMQGQLSEMYKVIVLRQPVSK